MDSDNLEIEVFDESNATLSDVMCTVGVSDVRSSLRA